MQAITVTGSRGVTGSIVEKLHSIGQYNVSVTRDVDIQINVIDDDSHLRAENTYSFTLVSAEEDFDQYYKGTVVYDIKKGYVLYR